MPSVPRPAGSSCDEAGSWDNTGEAAPMKNRILSALVAYGILIALASYLLRGKVLAAVLILFAGLIAKTLIAIKAGWRAPGDSQIPE